tara:strand:+ start:1470 stop:2696 length:1227 start_codon:yes stop_codon:yes gene_type:complete
MNSEQVDVLVIGAGPSGAAAASMVNRAGLKVKVVEKSTFPRFVIGESLLPRCMNHFEEMGVLEALKKQGYQKKIGASFRRDDKICQFEFADQYSESWDWTWQVPRDEFDKVLADEVQAQGVDFEYETTVETVKFSGSNSSTLVTGPDGEQKEINAKFLVDASGYGRVLPNLLDLNEPSTLPSRTSIFTHAVEPDESKRDDIERITIITIAQDVWFWIIPFSNGKTSIGFTGNTDYMDKFEGNNEEKMRKLLADHPYTKERFSESEFAIEVQRIDGYSIGISKMFDEGYVLTGNTGEFLDPVFSSGVTLALESGLTAGKLAAKQVKGEGVDWQKEYAEYLGSGVEAFRVYVEAWYEGTLQDIFYSQIEDGKIKAQVTSILAGHVWKTDNPMIHKSAEILPVLAKMVSGG